MTRRTGAACWPPELAIAHLLAVEGLRWAWHDFEDAQWAAAVRGRVLPPGGGGDAFALALAARALQSESSGLALACAGWRI